MSIKEKITESIQRIYQLALNRNTKLTRDFYRENKDPDLDVSEHMIINEYGSWSEALKTAFNIVEDEEDNTYDYNPDHLDPDYELVKKTTRKGMYKVLVIPDVHIPFHSKKALDCVIRIAEAYGPDEVIQLGDLCDFYKISKYTKDPRRGESVQKELDKAYKLLRLIKKRSGATRATFLEGNHEFRLHKYICTQAPGFSDMRALNLESLLQLKDAGWDYIPQHQFYQINNVHFTHGEFVSTHSSQKHVASYDETIVHGHTHRIACNMVKFLNRTLEGWELGCLASLKVAQEYQKSANWQHGCGTVDIYNDQYWIRPHHIRDGCVSWNGRVIEGSNEDPIPS